MSIRTALDAGEQPRYGGPTALQAARNYRLKFVLLDIGLLGMDGYEAARRLRDGRTLAWMPRFFAVRNERTRDPLPAKEKDRPRSRPLFRYSSMNLGIEQLF
jgi:CheY-like chemotaxis protein